MKILITGANGFIGKNLIVQLKNKGYNELFKCDTDTSNEQLDSYLQQCDFIFHLAGVNRSENPVEFETGNIEFTCEILNKLKLFQNNCPILATSSSQALSDSPYGKSKKSMEAEIFSYGKLTNAYTYVYRLPNVFGKWCKPNYNSVVATFCHNIARGLPICIDDEEKLLQLIYIDDVVSQFIEDIDKKPKLDDKGFCFLTSVSSIKLGVLAEKLYGFNKNCHSLIIPSFENDFDRKLYSTFVSYLEINNLAYKLDAKYDQRGTFFECIKASRFGQISVSITKPGYTRGNHWHHTKVEKFLIIQGEAVLRLRKLGEEDITEYSLSGDIPEIVDVPVGYIHSIKNIGDSEMVMLIWCDEIFDPQMPDTYFEEVIIDGKA